MHPKSFPRTFGGGVSVSVSGRIPLGVLSGNAPRCPGLKAPPPDQDADLSVWAVIRPGHVREKIAIFAAEGRWSDPAHDPASPAGLRRHERVLMVCAAKAKGSRGGDSTPKRRRRSENNPKLPRDQRNQLPGEQPSKPAERSGGGAGGDEDRQKVSVGEMVAFLERRASKQKPRPKPAPHLQRSSASITLSRPPAPPEVRPEEEPDSVRVSDMVARLEGECVRRQKEGGGVSRSSSLRRGAGRVLLTAGDHSPPPSRTPPPPAPPTAPGFSPEASVLTAPPSGGPAVRAESAICRVAPPLPSQEEEPLPGLLFLSPPGAEAAPPPQSDHGDITPPPCATPCPPPGREGRGPAASPDFLALRRRLQRLLAPQPLLLLLPPHLLLKILLLLPTRSLAALKCACTRLRLLIDDYAPRPADSLWVSDPRYRDDPCKQCKRRHRPGDVSLCRWHHKPYCQALPYGPGYWMCCRGARRDAPGCNVGLHDNRWVPAFHSINVPIYRGSRSPDN
ncbi:LOW QUALITY PROTEIN: F-box only protein 34 [Menidia menidia]